MRTESYTPPAILNPEPTGASTAARDPCARMERRMRGGVPTRRVKPDLGSVPAMSSSSREPVATVCWNCDRQADDVASVTLRAQSGEQVAVALCRDCHAASYLPLAA